MQKPQGTLTDAFHDFAKRLAGDAGSPWAFFAALAKLDELIRGMNGARNRLIDLEDMSEEELDDLQRQFVKLRRQQ